ncbi:hypothetical protein [Micromonospora sp. NPDC004551]|uniref:hypothetical protein n=1 Tax=Micromonospora sp. NPDC004551 TaxID=3154284 RepID=UPI0033A7D4C3
MTGTALRRSAKGGGEVNMGKLGDTAVGAVGDIAGAVVDPRAGLGRLRAAVTPRSVLLLGGGLLLGYLLARRRF